MDTFIPARHRLGCICIQCQPETRTADMYADLFPVVCKYCNHQADKCDQFRALNPDEWNTIHYEKLAQNLKAL